jgi:endonuclease YncB( thermonuclease family)
VLYPAELPGLRTNATPHKNGVDAEAGTGQASSMKFDAAHRRRAPYGRLLAAAPGPVFVVLLTLYLSGAGFAACGSPGGRARVAGVGDRLEIALEDGRTVRLGGLDVPDPEHVAPDIAMAAHEFLAGRLVGRDADLALLAGATDRWGRVMADLTAPEEPGGTSASVASALLAAGYAWVRPEFETRGCAAQRLALEEGARRAGLGIWREHENIVIQASDAPELRRRDGQFVIIEGTVRRVGFGRSRLYLDLVSPGDLTVVVARKLEAAFARAGRPVDALVGQTIRARGALDARFGPRIEVDEPAMVEILNPSSASGDMKSRP